MIVLDSCEKYAILKQLQLKVTLRLHVNTHGCKYDNLVVGFVAAPTTVIDVKLNRSNVSPCNRSVLFNATIRRKHYFQCSVSPQQSPVWLSVDVSKRKQILSLSDELLDEFN